MYGPGKAKTKWDSEHTLVFQLQRYPMNISIAFLLMLVPRRDEGSYFE